MARSKTHLDGIRLMIQAAFAFSLMALCVKALSSRLPSMEIVFYRSFLGLVLIWGVMKHKKEPVVGRSHIRLLLRGLSGFGALALFFHAMTVMPLGTAVMLNYTAPFFVVLLSRIFLKETITLPVFLLVLLSFSGVYLLVEGSLPAWNFSVALALLSAVLAAVSYVMIRSMRHHESPLRVIFYFTAISTAGAFVLMLPEYRWPQVSDWPYLACLGLGAFFGQLWMTLAISRAPASLVTPFSYLTPVLSFLYGAFFFGEPLSPIGAAGIAVTVSGGILLSHFGTLHARPEPPAAAVRP